MALGAVGLLAIGSAGPAYPAGPPTHRGAQPATSTTTSTTTQASQTSAPQPPGISLGPGAPSDGTTETTSAPAVGGASSSTPSPGLFDITGHIVAAIDAWFSDLVTSALNPVLDLLGNSLLSTPDVTGQSRIAGLWSTTQAMADALLVLFILAGAAIVMGYETLQTRTAAKEVAPRLIVAAITANASISLCGLAIGLANAASKAVVDQGANSASAAVTIKQLVLGAMASGGIFLILLGGVVAVLGLVVLATFIVRTALVILLVVSAPVALICHALPQTESLAYLWWRAFAGCLLTQLGQSLVLVTAIRVFLGSGESSVFGLASTSGLVDLLVSACLCWVLIRIPTWVGRMIFSNSKRSSSSAGRFIRNVVVFKAVKALAAGAL